MKIKNNIYLIFAVLSFSLFLLVQVVLDNSKPMAQISKTDEKKNLHISKTIKGLEVKDYKGQSINFDQFTSSLTLLNFWASWCVPCLEEIPTLVEFSNSPEAKKLSIITINGDDLASSAKAIKIIKKNKMEFKIIFDQDGSLFEKFGISGIPVTLIIKNGKVLKTYNEAVDFMSEEFRLFVKKESANE